MGKESSCQNKTTACGSCCGIYNLELDFSNRKKILYERTKEFSKIDLDANNEIITYRNSRENIEKIFNRVNKEIYLCPFLGYILENKPGCLLHPEITKKNNSQNFSFYGASICQSYDCKVKERDLEMEYSKLIMKSFPGSDEYGRLYPDFLFYSFFAIQKKLIMKIRNSKKNSKLFKAFIILCKTRLLSSESKNMTSFELKFAKNSKDPSELFHILFAGLQESKIERIDDFQKKVNILKESMQIIFGKQAKTVLEK